MREEIRCFSVPHPQPPFFITLSGTSYCDGSYCIRRKNSPETVLEYVLRGNGTLLVDGKTYTASAGHIYILHQGTTHVYRSDDREPWVKMFFNIHGTLAEKILREYSLGDTVVTDGEGLEEDFRQALQLSFDPVTSEGEIFERVAVRFLDLVIKMSQRSSRTGEEDEMARLREYLTAHSERIVSNAELASVIYRSEDYCIKKFKKAFGKTPYEYQLTCKIQTAQELLRGTRLPIGLIAAKVGYSDPQYFSNLFKKRCGLSPSQYRRK